MSLVFLAIIYIVSLIFMWRIIYMWHINRKQKTLKKGNRFSHMTKSQANEYIYTHVKRVFTKGLKSKTEFVLYMKEAYGALKDFFYHLASLYFVYSKIEKNIKYII